VRARLEAALQLAAGELQQQAGQQQETEAPQLEQPQQQWDAAGVAERVEAALLAEHGGSTSREYKLRAQALWFNLKASCCSRQQQLCAAARLGACACWFDSLRGRKERERERERENRAGIVPGVPGVHCVLVLQPG
jgi:hypothetical protein